MTLAETIKAWRKREGITAEEAAHRLSMSVRTLRHIELGRKYNAEGPLRLAIKYLEGQHGKTE
ncbi:helix-turn-helix domain-containing protein [Sinorhizobium medicae]|nr:helix-turn-helix domain-containing protein [Sinorhizobium medicae]MDX0900065.1 helix-turn-helix domain-containing protein [Sinorhizobium medicae]MDX1045409.1 helix-turn-helix domain-containing protein [Sinorhizobium medicae]MDX1119778.1 helix-turn-helix domain-containing protein [Sinorhizobium medicae]MDX1132021.1 helix-turn-helix domain-containing protein [Sinorhizobium medicae]